MVDVILSAGIRPGRPDFVLTEREATCTARAFDDSGHDISRPGLTPQQSIS
jgi:hypothetical protein